MGEGDRGRQLFIRAAVLFTITPVGGGLDAAWVAVLDLATGTQTVVVRGGHHAHYVPSGHLVYATGGTPRAVAFDLTRLANGDPLDFLRFLVRAAPRSQFR